MKVYAKIESERASKGQGGNKYLDINLFGGTSKKSVPIGSLYLHVLDLEDEEEYNGTMTAIEIVFVSSEGGIQYQEIIKLNTKGEKLKTANVCKFCGHNKFITDNDGDKYCESRDCEMYQ